MTPRCQNYRDVIDALDAKHPAPELVEAVAHMCAGCALRPTCWEDNKRQQWLVNVHRWRPAQPISAVGGWAKRQHARIEALESAARLGLGVTEVTESLGTTYNGLREWCNRHGQKHLFGALKRNERTAA